MTQIEAFVYLSIRYSDEGLEILDQTQLPDKEIWLKGGDPQSMFDHIKRLSVRGAPLIGVAAAMCLAAQSLKGDATKEGIIKTAEYLRSARPTAVNLMNSCDAIIASVGLVPSNDHLSLCNVVVNLARDILVKEVEMNDSMSCHGASLVSQGEGILTHCNTGGLATPGKGTALGVIRTAHLQGKKIHVYVDETRPLLQGARLTAYELQREGIPYTLICDNMAATLMRQGKIQRVLVGSDRIAMNGDFANKIGTYSVAVLAKHHGIPFHTVAPASTVDPHCPNGDHIPIEERKKDEVLGASGSFGSVTWAPKESLTYNPAFDVTPVELVTSIVLDTGVYTREDIQQGKLKTLPHYVKEMTEK